MTERKCTHCDETKPLDLAHFPQRGDGRGGGFRPECRVCFRALRRERARTEPRRAAPGARRTVIPPQPAPRKRAPASPIYLVTYAQNATPVHAKFLASLRQYCAHRGATLLVIPGRYKNPTSRWSQRAEHDDWWAPELHADLFEGRKACGKHLTIYGDVSISPTDARPVNGFEVHCGEGSGVFAHPRLHFKTVASGRRMPRILTSTGAVTVKNYIPAKAGKKAEQLHCLGACVVEQDGDLFHLRQVVADPVAGEFTDLDTHWTPAGPLAAAPALSLTLGDIHVAKSDAAVLAATFGPGGVVQTLRPETLVLHDVLDWDTRNHHDTGRVDLAWDRRHGLRNDDAAKEVREALEFLDRLETPWVVVRSNHDDAFDRWLNRADPKTDPMNMLLWCETWAAKIRERLAGAEWPDAFELAWRTATGLRRAGAGRFLGLNEPCKIGGVAANFHGHKGPNGSRGTRGQYAKLGVPVSIGHSHSPGIEDFCFQAGVTGNVDQGYNDLPSTALNTHIVQYATRARCLISVINGRFSSRQPRSRRRRVQ